MYLTFLLTLTICCLSQIFSIPVPIDSTCSPCTWTEWFNVDHPQEGPNGGDWETLQKIKAQGFEVCRAPRNIQCRSVQFPDVPFKELKYNTSCERNKGLICLNKDNDVPCTDYEVQFLCCPCDEVPDSPIHLTTVIPLLPANPTCFCKWTEWINANRPTTDPNGGDWETLGNITAQGFHVCQDPENINCRSAQFPCVPFKDLKYNAQCEKSTGLTCLNKDNDGPCTDFEVQFLCCSCDEVPHTTMQIPTGITTSCSNARCTWTEWFNTHRPTPGPHGGDFENVTEIIKRGYSVCTAPLEAECGFVMSSYVPLDEQYYSQECTASRGLVCLNENQKNGDCPDYEVRFLCCNCEDEATVTPRTDALVIMANTLDKTDDMTSN